MGSRIACHFANAGFQVLLLDMVPKSLGNPELETSKAFRNSVAQKALEAAIKSNPAPLFIPDLAASISVGNFDDDFEKLKTVDWTIEVVVENLEVKQSIFERVDRFRKPGSIVSSNTSGIVIQSMAEGRSDDFKAHFLGTHFFNPPRYLPLLEVIPTTYTAKEITDFVVLFADKKLGKTAIVARDTPAFIANRIGVFAIMDIFKVMDQQGLTIAEVDKLTGPVIGHPKSATFRTSDVVGLDTLIKVARGLYAACPTDEARETFVLPKFLEEMEQKQWLGDKTGQGFYKKIGTGSKKEIQSLDLKTLEYRLEGKVSFATLEATKTIDDLSKRWKVLVAGSDKAGQFYSRMLAGLFSYSANRLGEIAPDVSSIDEALKAGFGWEQGPFETWDSIGLAEGVTLIQSHNLKVPAWLTTDFISSNHKWYKVAEGQRLHYNQEANQLQPPSAQIDKIYISTLRNSQKAIWSNSGSTIFDTGNGIALLEFHTKMNTMGAEVIEGVNKAISLAEKSFDGLVIGNQGQNFSAGANLAMVFMYAIDEDWDELDMMIRQFQATIMRVRYSGIPVVVAPHALTLGGGCEMTMHADGVQAAAETYIGLVEVGVGVIPGGGGTKETALRVSDRYQSGDGEINALTNAFMNIAMAKVATSAAEAQKLGILLPSSRISMNKTNQLADAKAYAIELAEAGYVQPTQRKNIKVQGKAALGTLIAGIQGMRFGSYISDHDVKVATKLAYTICGGDLSYPQHVSEQYLLDLERDAFLSLCGEKKTLERIQSILQSGKPLRN